MFATPQIERRAVAQRPSSEVVCLVDDDPMVLRSIGRLLGSDGFAVQPFNKGADFIAYVAAHDVRLVVLDLWMKEMTGLEVLARLCAISPKTNVIVITGHDDRAARLTAMQIGAVAFLVKPFNDKQLIEAVHRALSHATDTSRLIKPAAHHRFSFTRDSAFIAPSLDQRPDKKSSRNVPKVFKQENRKELCYE
ncbi:MAG: response regulator [Candidatus Udaeobacter sp.]